MASFMLGGAVLAKKQGLLNKLLSPGALIIGHEKLEHVGCLKCHSAGDGVPDTKCLACHKDIKKSVQRKKSFHGLAKKSCFECHADHKGREYDSTQIDQKEFDHNKTGYILAGKHAKIKCIKCHTTKRVKKGLRQKATRWFGNSTSCKICHQKDNKHYFSGKWKIKTCDKCHNEKKWDQIHDFDHTLDTKYPLKGKHQKIKCSKCHLNPKKQIGIYKWKNLKRNKCLTCHKDQHKRNLSKKFSRKDCTQCHSHSQWKINKFKHKVTGFTLKGKHRKLKCSKCHQQNKFKQKLKPKDWMWKGVQKKCSNCHKDYHGVGAIRSNRFGNLKKCQSCHQQSNWKDDIDFDHDFDTKWKRTGKHLKVACFQCHIPRGKSHALPNKKGRLTPFNKNKENKNVLRNYHWKKLKVKTCNTCHVNPHLKTFKRKLLKKKCTECHSSDSWRTIRKGSGSFNHNYNTNFKLTGMHKKLSCNKCHKIKGKQVYKFKHAEKQYCISCHQNVHLGQFSKKFTAKSCSECHTTKNFKKLKYFNHKKTKFRHTGKHKKIANACYKCHKKSKFVLKTRPRKKGRRYLFAFANEGFCESCHTNEHKNQFHRKFSRESCSECHVTTSFNKMKKFDHASTRFTLKHKHKKIKCNKCHIKTKEKFKQKPRRHKRKFVFRNLSRSECSICHKDKHKGDFGSACSECHSEKSWKSGVDFHKNFTLSGVHFSLQCNECHIDNRSLEGLSDNCFLCHQKDDVHNGTLSDCGSCHRQQFWETTSFRHSMTDFPLRGSHRSLDCSSCHGLGLYQNTPSECVDCHRADANAAVFPNHSLAGFNECSECHNQFIFNK